MSSWTIEWRYQRKYLPDDKRILSPVCYILLGMQSESLDETDCDPMSCLLIAGVCANVAPLCSAVVCPWPLDGCVTAAYTLVTPFEPISRTMSFTTQISRSVTTVIWLHTAEMRHTSQQEHFIANVLLIVTLLVTGKGQLFFTCRISFRYQPWQN